MSNIYTKKYSKYHNKYQKLIQNKKQTELMPDNYQFGGSRKSVAQQYIDKLSWYDNWLDNNIITLDMTESIVNFFASAQKSSYDVEFMHVLEDKLIKKIINSIATQQITWSDAVAISKSANKLIAADYLKWYA